VGQRYRATVVLSEEHLYAPLRVTYPAQAEQVSGARRDLLIEKLHRLDQQIRRRLHKLLPA
jgi:hypothetical protein